MLLSSAEKKHSGTTRTGYLGCLEFTIIRIQMFHRLWQQQLVFVLNLEQISSSLILKGIFSYLKTAVEHPNAKHPDNIMAYEAAVSTCGKLNQFVSLGTYTSKFILLWLSHLPIRCNLDEAKISHELLCSMMETSEQKVIGPDGSCTPNIIAILAEVLWAGNNLATEETRTRIINLLKKFQREMQPPVLSNIFETLPLPHQNMLRTILSTL